MRISDWSSDVCSSDLHSNFVLTEDSRGVKLQRLDGVETVGASRDPLSRKEPAIGMEEGRVTKTAPAAALLYAALIVGASEAVLDMCVEYALHRTQLGRPIARPQATGRESCRDRV